MGFGFLEVSGLCKKRSLGSIIAERLMLLLLTSCISSARIAFVAPKILYSHKFLVELDLCYLRKYMEGCFHSTFPDFCGQGGIRYKVFERASLEFIYIHVIGAQVSS